MHFIPLQDELFVDFDYNEDGSNNTDNEEEGLSNSCEVAACSCAIAVPGGR